MATQTSISREESFAVKRQGLGPEGIANAARLGGLAGPSAAESVPSPEPVPTDLYPMFPSDLKQVSCWVVWKYENRGEERTKVPYSARSGKKADSTDPSTWADYSTVVSAQAGYDGIGCVIAPPYVGIDLDKCRCPANGQVEPWAERIIQELDSYAEVSPSGCGFHIWVRGTLPEGQRRAGRVEMYDRGRYFTVTGKHLEGTPRIIESRDLESLHSQLATLDPANKKPPASVIHPTTSGSNFNALMDGHWKDRYQSQSEADLALCVALARKHDCDPNKIDTEFRQSGLYREKWERDDYRERTIKHAIDLVGCPVNGQGQYQSEESRAGSGGSPPAGDRNWRSSFKSYYEMESGEPRFLITDFLPQGVTFIGGLPGSGKTWFALSLAKALATGRPFLGHYKVPTPFNVLYLIPEVGERAFRSRLEKMRLTTAGDSFLCCTMGNGVRSLRDRALLGAVEAQRPVVVLDTAIRFSTAADENSASDNKQLADGIFGLISAGARGVVGIHHAVKSSARTSELTLETALRGTGDMGAICDAVWGLRCEHTEGLRISVQCVKARDFEVPKPFQIMGRPYIGDRGDFVLADKVCSERRDNEVPTLVDFLPSNLKATYREIAESTGIPLKRIKEVADAAGWKQGENGWVQITPSLFDADT